MKVDVIDVPIRTCPLCGGPAFLKANNFGPSVKMSNRQYWVKCNDLDCGCTIDAVSDQAMAVKRWNQRAQKKSLASNRFAAALNLSVRK